MGSVCNEPKKSGFNGDHMKQTSFNAIKIAKIESTFNPVL